MQLTEPFKLKPAIMTKMKPAYLINKLFALCILLAFGLAACDDDNDDLVDVDLDAELFGRWEHYDPAGNVEYAWEFNSDATATQFIYDDEYDFVEDEIDWLWEIENDQLKLYVEGGVPRYMTYQVEDDMLFFWVEQINDWGAPYFKVD